MLYGRYEHSLDEKGRLSLPAAYAGSLEAGVFVTVGLEGCLYLFPVAEFDKLSEQARQLSLTDGKARKLWRRLFAMAHPTQLDRQRRILIPKWLRDEAGISDRVVIAGVNRFAELWSPEQWEAQKQIIEDDLTDGDFFAGFTL